MIKIDNEKKEVELFKVQLEEDNNTIKNQII